MAKKRNSGPDRWALLREEAISNLKKHPLFRKLLSVANIASDEYATEPSEGLCCVTSAGLITFNKDAHASSAEWEWAFAHCLLHLGFEHFDDSKLRNGEFDPAWNSAACESANRFLEQLQIGQRPASILLDTTGGNEDQLFELYQRKFPGFVGSAGSRRDMKLVKVRWGRDPQWGKLLASGLEAAVSAAVNVAGGAQESLSGGAGSKSEWQQAISWFMSSYPLLGALASGFKVVEDADVCSNLSISVAAVSPARGELYLNPRVGLNALERRFVVAHELLHAGLRHDTRIGGRHSELWNYATDYAINGWLVEMNVGTLPMGLLYDAKLKGMSAESIYDKIVKDQRHYRKLATLRGSGLGDIIHERLGSPDEDAVGVDLDEFYRRSLTQGLEFHKSANRGYIAEGLEQEIKALNQPPIAWDVELARWFDVNFPPVERKRTYSRLSRRQASSPEIPRPAWYSPQEEVTSRTFAVVLDTSGSMSSELLGKALGSVASYATAHDVVAVRVVFCDAAAYDAGYMPTEDIANKVRVLGRGGTILQPGIDLVENAKDFPADGPVLIITDGYCDPLQVSYEHAFLVPKGRNLPFKARGPVFYFE